MASVWKRGAKWVIEYTDRNGKRKRKTGFTDKSATQKLASRLEEREHKFRTGMLDPGEERRNTERERDLRVHVGEWKSFLLAKGNTAKHAEQSAARVLRVLDAAKADRIGDLSPSGVLGALATFEVSAETRNHYIRAVKGFSRWLYTDGRSNAHALASLATRDSSHDRRVIRRELTPEESLAIVRAAETGPRRKGLDGPDRAMLYRSALASGLRVSELASLSRDSLTRDGPLVVLVVRAAYSKRRREDKQPIPPELAEAVREWAKDRPGKLWPGKWWAAEAAKMLKADARAAGVAIETPEGKVDFHALRHTYISRVVARTDVKTAQVLARHSTPSLTIGRYAKTNARRVTEVLESMSAAMSASGAPDCSQQIPIDPLCAPSPSVPKSVPDGEKGRKLREKP
jgi:integrase/recombinase XerD